MIAEFFEALTIKDGKAESFNGLVQKGIKELYTYKK